MADEKLNLILKELETLVDQDRLDLVLPAAAPSGILSNVLGRVVHGEKHSRNYALGSFSALYSRALPFMRHGVSGTKKGEIAFLSEVLSSLIERGGRPDLLVLASQEGSEVKFPFRRSIENELFSEMFLKTKGGDSYESLLREFIAHLEESLVANQDDIELIKEAALSLEIESRGVGIEVLNPFPGYHSRTAYRSSSGGPIPESVSTISDQIIGILDRRPLSTDLFVPVIKDLVLRVKSEGLTEDSISLGALSPLFQYLEERGVLGIVFEIEDGRLKKVSLPRVPGGERVPPAFSPYRAMCSVLISLTNGSPDLIENYDILKLHSRLRKQKGFFAVTSMGAVSVPSDPQMAYMGVGGLTSGDSKPASLAVETFVFSPRSKKAILLDPVSVAYDSPDEEYEYFMATRLCFYAIDPSILTPVHQGNLCIGVDQISYESACLDDGGRIALRILSESSEFLTDAEGEDQIVNTVEDALDLLRAKYGFSWAMRKNGNIPNERLIEEVITGRVGPNTGLTSEVYSLFYQSSHEQNPTMFASSIHTPRFLCDVRTWAQRFDLKTFLNEEDV